MVERFFRDVTDKSLRLVVLCDVEDLTMAIGNYIDHPYLGTEAVHLDSQCD